MIERVVVLMMSVGLCAPMAQAGIVPTGDVIPADPTTWTTSTTAYIGKTGVGSVAVDDGSDLVSSYGYLGYYQSGSAGAVTVSGVGSTWTSSSDIFIGHGGDATLDITDGGAVSNVDGYIGHNYLSTGVVTVSGLNGAET